MLCTVPVLSAPTQTVMVTMSDGVGLATDVYLPDGAGPFPVVVMRTPYDRGGAQDTGDSLRNAGETRPTVGAVVVRRAATAG